MAMVLSQHIGKKGDKGPRALDGSGVGARYSLIENPVIRAFRQNKVDPNVTFTRTTEGTITDRYGNQTVIAGDDIVHILANSNDFDDSAGLSFEWQDPDGIWTRNTTNETDPDGGSTASQISFTSTTGQTFGFMGNVLAGADDIIRVSIWVKVISGTLNKISLQLGSAGSIVDFPQTPSAGWARFSLLVSEATATSELRYLFDAPSGCVVHAWMAQATEGTELHEEYATGDARPETVANSLSVYRANNLGYCIEESKTNTCPSSQNIGDWTISGGATVTPYNQPDAYGDVNTETLVTFGGETFITLTQDVTLTEGASYTVSLFCVANQGDVQSVTFQLGGGVTQTVDITTTFERQSIEVVAGATNFLTISATTSVTGSSFVLSGVQVELGEPTSYIATGTGTATRAADLVSFPANKAPDYRKNWTMMLAWNGISENGTKYLFTDNTGSISVSIVDSDLVIDFGAAQTITGQINAIEIIMVYDVALGSIGVWIDGVLNTTFSQVISGTVPTSYLLGRDSASGNYLNGYLRVFDWYDYALTEQEVRQLSGVDYGNRNS